MAHSYKKCPIDNEGKDSDYDSNFSDMEEGFYSGGDRHSIS